MIVAEHARKDTPRSIIGQSVITHRHYATANAVNGSQGVAPEKVVCDGQGRQIYAA
jgi:hypothetical protein